MYINDIIKGFKENLKHIDEALRLLMKAVVTIKLKKFSHYSKRIAYVGHVITLDKQQMAWKTAEAVKASQSPANICQSTDFLGTL